MPCSSCQMWLVGKAQNWRRNGNTLSTPSTRNRPRSMDSRDTKSNAPTPSIESAVNKTSPDLQHVCDALAPGSGGHCVLMWRCRDLDSWPNLLSNGSAPIPLMHAPRRSCLSNAAIRGCVLAQKPGRETETCPNLLQNPREDASVLQSRKGHLLLHVERPSNSSRARPDQRN